VDGAARHDWTRLEISTPGDWLTHPDARWSSPPIIPSASRTACHSRHRRAHGWPYRILINADFMRVPEIQQITCDDFAETSSAGHELKTAPRRALLLKEGVAIVIFR
jgi:hypothetical protein